MVNDKSRKNVWWKCRTCGYEWKSVINARVKGAACPVCADRAVLSGYNDLATTDVHLIDEWDFDKNTDFSPERISRNSMYSVWWKCQLNHSWKAKVSERAIEGKGCRVCETEYKNSLLKLAVMYYAGMKGLSFEYDDDGAIGIPLETYIADEKLAIETNKQNESILRLKKYLCAKRNIKLICIPFGGCDDVLLLNKIKQDFHSIHIYIDTDTNKDAYTDSMQNVTLSVTPYDSEKAVEKVAFAFVYGYNKNKMEVKNAMLNYVYNGTDEESSTEPETSEPTSTEPEATEPDNSNEDEDTINGKNGKLTPKSIKHY